MTDKSGTAPGVISAEPEARQFVIKAEAPTGVVTQIELDVISLLARSAEKTDSRRERLIRVLVVFAQALSDRNLAELQKELSDERLAHEEIADMLLPLVGTPDGTSVGAVKAVVAEVERLRVGGGWGAGRDAAAEKVEHFLDELTPEEWPKHGLCRVDGRFDSGWSANVIPVLVHWIRALKPPAPSSQTQPTCSLCTSSDPHKRFMAYNGSPEKGYRVCDNETFHHVETQPTKEKQFISAQIAELDRLIARLPADDVLGRIGLQSRRNELAEMQPE